MKDPSSLPTHDEPTHGVVIYDQQTGKVVHVHEFVADPDAGGWSVEDMTRIALEAAGRGRGEQGRMAAIDLPADLRRSGRSFRVDVAARTLVADARPETPRSKKTGSK
jgi:hypothetical protein